MDILLENMDTVHTHCGQPQYISSAKELLQRVKIACTVQKGSFVYDREFGAGAVQINADDELICSKLEMIFKEATADIPYCDLKVVTVSENDTGVAAQLEVYYLGEVLTTEVTLNANYI